MPSKKSSRRPTESVAPVPQNQQPISSEAPSIRYPPFPSVPTGIDILPYAQFKEVGIKINGVLLPKEENSVDDGGTEVDGLGIPTVSLRIRHDTDVCKTLTKGRRVILENGKERMQEEKEKANEGIKTDQALELRKKKKSNKEWYDQWEEREATRRTRVYDSDLSIIDRIHVASSEFRSKRTWPPASIGLGYLWDQFRIYTGLLGQPPVWYRTDLQQNPDDAVEDEEDEDEEELAKPPQAASASSQAPQNQASSAENTSDDRFFDDEIIEEDSDERGDTHPSTNIQDQGESRQPQKRKRIPVRTPYALHDIDPLPLSSEYEVRALLDLASLRKHQKLLNFLSSPDTVLRIFFSWYLYHQGFVYSPSYLANLPRLVQFFLEFVLKTNALPESERALRRAVEIVKTAVTEVPAAGRLCRLLPDKMGSGCVALWGKVWVEEEAALSELFEENKNESERKEDAVRKFEEELRKENVQVVSADNVVPPAHKEVHKSVVEQAEKEAENAMTDITIAIKLEGGPSPTARIEELIKEDRLEDGTDILKIQNDQGTLVGEDHPNYLLPTSEVEPTFRVSTPATCTTGTDPTLAMDEQSIPWHWDTTSDVRTEPTPAEIKQALLSAWAPSLKSTQPLMALLGMTVLPLKFEPGVAERSMRKVRMIIRAGEKAQEERRWKGVQEELVQKLARIVLEPWLDWDDGGLAGQYKRPSVQVRPNEKTSSENEVVTKKAKEEIDKQPEEDMVGVNRYGKRNHDATKDMITVLVEPRVAEQLSVGMGLAGTWVQIVRIAGSKGGGGNSGRGDDERADRRGRGRGRGGWCVRGKMDVPKTSADIESIKKPPHVTIVEPEENEVDQKAEEEPASDGKRKMVNEDADAPPQGSRGRGRGGYYHHSGTEKEYTFWYVEDIHMTIPSFWMAGEEEEPLKLPDDLKGQKNELPAEFED